jgi:hypothetical protein
MRRRMSGTQSHAHRVTIRQLVSSSAPIGFAASQERPESADEPSRGFGRGHHDDLPVVAVAFDLGPCGDNEGGEVDELVSLVVAELPGQLVAVEPVEHGHHGPLELGSHLSFATAVLEPAPTLSARVVDGEAEQDEPFAMSNRQLVASCAEGPTRRPYPPGPHGGRPMSPERRGTIWYVTGTACIVIALIFWCGR